MPFISNIELIHNRLKTSLSQLKPTNCSIIFKVHIMEATGRLNRGHWQQRVALLFMDFVLESLWLGVKFKGQSYFNGHDTFNDFSNIYSTLSSLEYSQISHSLLVCIWLIVYKRDIQILVFGNWNNVSFQLIFHCYFPLN